MEEGLHPLGDVAVSYDLVAIKTPQKIQQLVDGSVQKKKTEWEPRTDIPVSHQSLISNRNFCQLHDQEADGFEFRRLYLLADVAASTSLFDDLDEISPAEKDRKRQNGERQEFFVSSQWSLLVDGSDLKFRFRRINKNPTASSQKLPHSKPCFSSNPLDMLAQVAFAHQTSTLWALCGNLIPTRKRSTCVKRRPNFGGMKRRFAEFKACEKDEESVIGESSKRRRLAKPLPIQLCNYLASEVNISHPKLVIKKQLTGTDLNPHIGRLSIPVNQVIHAGFLAPEDRKKLNNKDGINVTLIQPCLEEKQLCLKKYDMKGLGIYALTSGWNSVFRNKKNCLFVGSTIEVWSFTSNGGLYFALTAATVTPDSRGNADSGDWDAHMEVASDDESTVTVQIID